MQGIFRRYKVYLNTKYKSNYTIRNYLNDLFGKRGLFQFLTLTGIFHWNIDTYDTYKERVTRNVLRDYVAWLMNQEIVKASISRRISAIRNYYRFLFEEKLITSNELPINISRKRGACSSSFSLKLDKRLPEFLSLEETVSLIEKPDLSKPEGLRDHALLELLYATGLRVSELASLDKRQIDSEKREIMVRGKGSKERVVLMGKPAAAALELYIKEGRPRLLKDRPGVALFLNSSGGRLSVRHIQRILKKYAGQAGIDRRVHPHMVRHTFATHMLDRGADLRVVQELLGHADLSSTQIYTHVTKAQARKVYLSAHPLAKRKSDGLPEEA